MTPRPAFTLMELVSVIVLIGVLASVAVPRLSHLQDNARITAELSTAASVQSALESCHGEWVVNEGAFACGYDLPSSDLNATTGFPEKGTLGASTTSPLNHILKSADRIGWSAKDDNITFYGPASDPTSGTDHCLDDKPCQGRCWKYDEGNGTFLLNTSGC